MLLKKKKKILSQTIYALEIGIWVKKLMVLITTICLSDRKTIDSQCKLLNAQNNLYLHVLQSGV